MNNLPHITQKKPRKSSFNNYQLNDTNINNININNHQIPSPSKNNIFPSYTLDQSTLYQQRQSYFQQQQQQQHYNSLYQSQSQQSPNNFNIANANSTLSTQTSPFAFTTQYNQYQAMTPQQSKLQSITHTMNLYNNFFMYHNHMLQLTNKTYHNADTLKTEYMELKQKEKENPNQIKQFLLKFENYILLPLYTTLNSFVNCKQVIYTNTYGKYLKAIQDFLLKENLLSSTKVQAYGSIMNNFLIDDGDIDICIVPTSLTIEQFSIHLKELKNYITNTVRLGSYVLSHISPRYSLLKIQDNETNLIIDITVHTMLPLHNTKLIRLYSLYDQRFHIMGIYLKHWAKRNKINGASEKYLSSYALLLMLIHFLQEEIKPSVLPILQKVENVNINYEYSHSDAIINCNVYFEEDMEKVKTYMNIINNNETNTESVTELLIKFFEFYAYKYDQSFLISISNSEKKVPSSEHIAFPIEDPFDIEHNPGKSMKLNTPQYELFLNCMKKEINMLMNGEYVCELNLNSLE